MNGALWLLIGFQGRGWLRYLGRSLRSFRGAMLAAVGFSVVGLWAWSVLSMPSTAAVDPERVRLYGPAGLLLYCVLNVLVSNEERAVYFTPAEVNFLFPGPFGRRQLLMYKVLSALLIAFPTTLFMLLFLRVYAPWVVAAYIGLLLVVLFMQLFAMALNLVASTLGAALYSRGRKFVVLAFVLVAVVAGVQSGGFPAAGVRGLAEHMAHNAIWRVALWPLGWFFDAFLATDSSELAMASAMGLMVNGVVLGIVLALDKGYMEAAAAASARIYARLQRIRRGGLAGDITGTSSRLSVPLLPWWGGIGPTLWRQATTAVRGLARLLFVFLILGSVVVLPALGGVERGRDIVVGAAGTVLWLTLFLTALVPFDFRGDLERMALLKTLPVPAWKLAIAEVLTPVLLLSVVQWLILAAVGIALANTESRESVAHPAMLVVAAAFVLPINFFLLALENFLFLLFPTRLAAMTPGDFQAMGRNILFMLAKVFGLAVVLTAAGLVGGGVWVATGGRIVSGALVGGNLLVAAAAGWPVVVLAGLSLVPLLALAFRKFDVTRDSPA